MDKVIDRKGIYELLPFGKTKINQLIKAGQLPVVKVGSDYITTFNIIEEWIRDNIGTEIYFN